MSRSRCRLGTNDSGPPPSKWQVGRPWVLTSLPLRPRTGSRMCGGESRWGRRDLEHGAEESARRHVSRQGPDPPSGAAGPRPSSHRLLGEAAFALPSPLGDAGQVAPEALS